MLSGMISSAISAAVSAAGAVSKKPSSSSSSGSSSSSSSKGSSSVSFDPNFDYAEAIANTTDAAERARLLQERQAKIDAMGLEGKVGSNEAVSVWTQNYRPYWVSSGEEDPSDLNVTGLYDAAAKARLQAFETARQAIGQRLQSQYDDIEQSYRQGMTQADVNARRSALGNEEKLAALGLSMGSAYGAPTSGYTETSRVAMDNAYRSDLNGLAAARLSARSAAAQSAAEQETSLLTGYYNNEASAALQQAQAALSQYNADRDYSISLAGLTGFLNGVPTMAYQQMQSDWALNQSQMQVDAQQTAYEQAVERWKTYGYVLPADAALLGVAAGTPTSDQSYRTAQLKL
ncbi:MAG: hypothetical protein Q3Y08_00770, partial [Butyricicoccus sp.]|nr:hypothetical protein [Butyricicoccus sp.]